MSFDVDAWIAAWGRNAVVWATLDYKLPPPPTDMLWAARRALVDGERVVRLVLVRCDEDVDRVVVGVSGPPDNRSVNRAATGLLNALTGPDHAMVKLQKFSHFSIKEHP